MTASAPPSAAVILAAGKGTRMKSELAKVLFPLLGRPLLCHVLDAVEGAGFTRSIAVVGHQHEQVREALGDRQLEFAVQSPQLGTGHAVQCASPLLLGFTGCVAVLAGDAPLIRAETLRRMLDHHQSTGATVTILTAVLPDATGYGRIIRDENGRVTAIVEDKDCTPEQRLVREINSSIYAFAHPFLEKALPRLSNNNRQGEYYLTDTVGMAFAAGLVVEGLVVDDFSEVSGINTLDQLEQARRTMEERTQ